MLKFFRKPLRDNKTIIVGIRHQIGLQGERWWLEDTIRFLDKNLIEGDSVMLELAEFPINKNEVWHSRVYEYLNEVCKFIINKNCTIVCGEDKSRRNDENYKQGNVRDFQFIKVIKEKNPTFFLVGFDHLEFLASKLSENKIINLVDEKKDKKNVFG